MITAPLPFLQDLGNKGIDHKDWIELRKAFPSLRSSCQRGLYMLVHCATGLVVQVGMTNDSFSQRMATYRSDAKKAAESGEGSQINVLLGKVGIEKFEMRVLEVFNGVNSNNICYAETAYIVAMQARGMPFTLWYNNC